MDHVIRHTAEEEPADRPTPVASDHHEIHLLAPSGVHDRFAGLAFPDQEGHANTRSATAGDKFLGGGLAPSSNLIDPSAIFAPRQPD